MNREYQNVAEREIASWAGVEFRVDMHGRHEKLRLTFNGQTRHLLRPRTPSDTRGPTNHRCDIKRKLKEMGATRS